MWFAFLLNTWKFTCLHFLWAVLELSHIICIWSYVQMSFGMWFASLRTVEYSQVCISYVQLSFMNLASCLVFLVPAWNRNDMFALNLSLYVMFWISCAHSGLNIVAVAGMLAFLVLWGGWEEGALPWSQGLVADCRSISPQASIPAGRCRSAWEWCPCCRRCVRSSRLSWAGASPSPPSGNPKTPPVSASRPSFHIWSQLYTNLQITCLVLIYN